MFNFSSVCSGTATAVITPLYGFSMDASLMQGDRVWLVATPALTFDHDWDFLRMHPLEIQAIADGRRSD